MRKKSLANCLTREGDPLFPRVFAEVLARNSPREAMRKISKKFDVVFTATRDELRIKLCPHTSENSWVYCLVRQWAQIRPHVCGSLPTTKNLTNLFPTNTIGIADVSWRSWIILLLRSLSSCQLDTELMANNTRNASPVATDESRNELYSSCPAVSTISTSYNLPLYSIYEKRRRCFHKIIITSLHHLRSSVVITILSIIVCFQI